MYLSFDENFGAKKSNQSHYDLIKYKNIWGGVYEFDAWRIKRGLF